MDPEFNELGGGDIPLAFQMMEHIPGIAASLGFAQRRATNTLLRGGFMDDRQRGPGKFGGFTRSGELVQPKASAYYGSSARRARLAQSAGTADGKMAFGKASRMNHITARPRALSRYNSLAMFNASENTAFYSPFQMMAKVAGGQAIKNEGFRKAVYGAGATQESLKGEQVFARGTISMVSAGRKLDLLEAKAKFLPDGTAANKAGRKVLKAQDQVRRLASMNNPAMVASKTFSGGQYGRLMPKSLGQGMILPAGATFTTKSTIDTALAGGQRVGLTGNLMAQAGGTQGTRFMTGYFRGALGMSGVGNLGDDAARGAAKAVSHLASALGEQGLKKSGAALAEKAAKEGIIKTIGLKRTIQVAGTKQGAMFLGARSAAMAIPGLNLLATASLVYDLGKMGGELVKSGVNLAKDAVKSMKGSIDKPMFGMGYKDNEVAATSRARGVMAIQNSRLNARSMLGSEGSMMAAHFG